MTPQQLANEARAAEKRFRVDRYRTLRAEGKSPAEAAYAIGIDGETTRRRYERDYQALLAAPQTSSPALPSAPVAASAPAPDGAPGEDPSSPAPPPDDAPTPPAPAGDAAEAPPGLLIPCPEGPAAPQTPAGEEPAGGAAPAGPPPPLPGEEYAIESMVDPAYARAWFAANPPDPEFQQRVRDRIEADRPLLQRLEEPEEPGPLDPLPADDRDTRPAPKGLLERFLGWLGWS